MFSSNIIICYRWVSLFIKLFKILNSPKSFDDLKIWLSDIRKNGNQELKVFLLGNKTDINAERIINTQEGIDIKQEFNINLFKETSVKDEKNAQNIFLEATDLLYNNISYINKNVNEKNIKQKDCSIF